MILILEFENWLDYVMGFGFGKINYDYKISLLIMLRNIWRTFGYRCAYSQIKGPSTSFQMVCERISELSSKEVSETNINQISILIEGVKGA